MSLKTVLVAFGLVIGAGAFWWWYSQRHPAGYGTALNSRQIATRVLGQQLARKFPGAKVLVVGNPFTQRKGQAAEIYAFERASLEGLQQGFGPANAVKVVYPELRPEFLQQPESVFVDPKTTTPLSFLVALGSFDRLTAANPEYNVVVSLIGVPVQIRDSNLWRDSAQPSLALLLPDWRMIGALDSIREAFRSGKVAAAVIDRPGGTGTDLAAQGNDYQVEFDRRYVLVTKENIDDLLRLYPKLF